MTSTWQPAILEPVPAAGRFLAFDLAVGGNPRPALARLRDRLAPAGTVVGVGAPLALAAGAEVPGLRPLPALAGPGCAIPSTQAALWAFLGGADPSNVHDRARDLRALLGDDFTLAEEVVDVSLPGRPRPVGLRGRHREPVRRGRDRARRSSHGAGVGLDGGQLRRGPALAT